MRAAGDITEGGFDCFGATLAVVVGVETGLRALGEAALAGRLAVAPEPMNAVCVATFFFMLDEPMEKRVDGRPPPAAAGFFMRPKATGPDMVVAYSSVPFFAFDDAPPRKPGKLENDDLASDFFAAAAAAAGFLVAGSDGASRVEPAPGAEPAPLAARSVCKRRGWACVAGRAACTGIM